MNEPLVEIRNRSSAGAPPQIEYAETRYLGYFENRYGEQWVLLMNPVGELMLISGKWRWERGYAVDIGRGQPFRIDRYGTVEFPSMTEEERQWLAACLQTIRERPSWCWDAPQPPVRPEGSSS